jgi:hypothetical protein
MGIRASRFAAAMERPFMKSNWYLLGALSVGTALMCGCGRHTVDADTDGPPPNLVAGLSASHPENSPGRESPTVSTGGDIEIEKPAAPAPPAAPEVAVPAPVVVPVPHDAAPAPTTAPVSVEPAKPNAEPSVKPDSEPSVKPEEPSVKPPSK